MNVRKKGGGDEAFQERVLNSFRYLCNTDSVNKQLSTEDVDELRSMIKQIPTPLNVNSDPTPTQTSLPKFTDRLKQLQRERDDEDDEKPIDANENSHSDDEESVGSAGSRETAGSARSRTSKGSERSAGSARSVGSAKSRKSSRRIRRPETYEQTKLKRNFLVILRTLQKEGYQPTQDFTMDDPLEDIKEEVEHYYMCKEATSFVTKWKNNVETGASLIEVGAQFIPKQPLKLQGLQARIRKVHDSKQVDIDWERIYYTYRRKKMTNPLWSLAITYGLAMLSTQITNYASAKLGSVLGGGGANNNQESGGLDLGGILGSLFGAFGGAPQTQGMPSMTSGLPGGVDPPSQPQSPRPQPQPQPRRGFKRNVFFT